MKLNVKRLEQGLEINRKSSRKIFENTERRNACKDKLQAATFSTTQNLNAVSLAIGNTSKLSMDDSIDEPIPSDNDTLQNTCLICYQTMEGTFAFILCGQGCQSNSIQSIIKSIDPKAIDIDFQIQSMIVLVIYGFRTFSKILF